MKEQNRPPSLMGDSLCGAMQLLAGGFCLRQCAYVETSGDRWLWFLGALLFLTAALWSGTAGGFCLSPAEGASGQTKQKVGRCAVFSQRRCVCGLSRLLALQ